MLRGVLYFSCPTISPSIVNTQARLARHAKLKLEQPSLAVSPALSHPAKGLLNRSWARFKRMVEGESNSTMMRTFKMRVVTLTLAFLVISPLLPSYQFTEGDEPGQGGSDILEWTSEDTDFTIQNVMTEDGFLLKPALSTTQSDRSSFNEVFAYSVEPGDTLSSIAERFGLNKETVMWENNIWNGNQLRVGMALKILPVDGVSHLVKKGQTAEGIAKKYNIGKDILIKQNQLEEETLIADTLLIIPGAKKALPTPSYVASAPSAPPSGQYLTAKGQFLWPVSKGARITQGFRRGHYAVDIANRARGPIYAAASGKVTAAKYGWNGGYGNMIIIDHGNGTQTLYAHNDKLYVSEGQYVEQGQTVSWMGNTGRSSGPHLHFEIRIEGVKYNPMNFFQ